MRIHTQHHVYFPFCLNFPTALRCNQKWPIGQALPKPLFYLYPSSNSTLCSGLSQWLPFSSSNLLCCLLPKNLCMFGLLWWKVLLHSPFTAPIGWAISFPSSSELRSLPSEPFPASHHHQTEAGPSAFTGLSSHLGNAHAFVPLSKEHLCPWPPGF